MITYKSQKKISPEKLFDLYESVKWTKGVKNKKKHGELLSKVYAHSDGVFSAWESGNLIGVVRFIADSYAHGLIYGLAIHPECQGNGVATELIKKCLSVYPHIQWSLEVESTPQFYEKLGFKESKHKLFSKGNCPV